MAKVPKIDFDKDFAPKRRPRLSDPASHTKQATKKANTVDPAVQQCLARLGPVVAHMRDTLPENMRSMAIWSGTSNPASKLAAQDIIDIHDQLKALANK